MSHIRWTSVPYREVLRVLNRGRMLLLRGLVRLNLSQDIAFILFAFLVGLAAGFGAVIFHEAIRLVQESLFIDLRGLLGGYPWSPAVIVLLPAIGGLLVGIVTAISSPEAHGHGVPDVIKAVIARGGYLRASLLLWKTITSALSIGSGGGAGREGPIILIGATAGSAVGQFFRLSTDQMRTLAAAGAAGGIAAIFNAPLGGVMFAVEIILGDFSVRSFSPIVVTSVVATAVSRTYLGNHPTFVATNYVLISNYELVFYLLLGTLAGVVSVGFIRLLFAVEDLFGRLRKVPRLLKPAVGGLAVGLLLLVLPVLAGYSYEINNQAILGKADITVLAFVVLLKPVAAGLTLGSGGSGGVFAPALKAGAAFGGCVGALLHLLLPEHTASSGAYALVGMGAMIAGTMHAPLTAMVIIFEISDTYQVILPIMFAAVSASVVARSLSRHSVYTLPLERQGIEIGYGINLSIVHEISVSEIMRKSFTTLQPMTPVRDVIRYVEEGSQTVFPVVDQDGGLLGVVRFPDLRQALAEPEMPLYIMADDIMIHDVPLLLESDSLGKALKTFELGDADALPVVRARDNQRLVGLITQDDALRRYRKEVLLRSER